jgi:hypothetical protein
VFAEVVSRIGERASGFLYIAAGDQHEVSGNGFSYVLEVTRIGGTDPDFVFALYFNLE